MRTLHIMQARRAYQRGQIVIARTPRGLEVGEVLTEATPVAVNSLKEPAGGSIQRIASPEDQNEIKRLTQLARDEFKRCQQIVGEMKIDMDLIDLEHIYGGERIVVYYLAEQRIDFRELVKRLAADFQTRIEMRQIGVRDEAKLLADYGDCGKPVCCNTHLHQMPPVSMKMAKMQKATLDPTKISGRCGRLKCCLRYEYDTYEELRVQLPPIGSDIVTAEGRAKVTGHEILSQHLVIQTEDNRRLLIEAHEVLSVIRRSSGRPRGEGGDDDEFRDDVSE
jgi:cell fate regulator YaaT (PSP1 superfamily)